MTPQAPPTAPSDLDALVRLVGKYNRPGPRYTSYPPAPVFDASFSSGDFASKLARLRLPRTVGDGAPPRSERPRHAVSLYVHLPFCRSLCYYCGCHMVVTHKKSRVEEYLGYVKREIDLAAAHIGEDNRVVQVHWGGGTPTYLEPAQISSLMQHLHDRFNLDDDAEISIEADPRGLTAAHLQAARESGFNRISMGVQDFDASVQEAINRIQSRELVEEATAAARRIGFESVSFDLIYGLPHQTLESFLRTVDDVIRIAPDRVALFSYAHVPWKKKHQQVIRDEWLPESQTKIRILVETVNRLTQGGGYRYIGMDHFAREDDPLTAALDAGTLQRNFQGYSTHAGSDLIGFGVSAISQIDDAYAQNHLDFPSYYASIDAGELPTSKGYRLTAEDRLRRYVIMHLMCELTLDVKDVERHFGIDFWTHFAPELRELTLIQEDGLLNLGASSITVKPLGRYFIRNVAMAFDAYLKPGRGEPRYSQTV